MKCVVCGREIEKSQYSNAVYVVERVSISISGIKLLQKKTSILLSMANVIVMVEM